MNLSELKNIDLKNIDVKDLVEKLKNNDLLKDKKFLTKFGIYFGSIMLFFIIYYAFVNPKVEAQKQRINIARGLYKKADIYIFDEITSSLDVVTKKNVVKSIFNFLGGKLFS